MLDPVHIQGLRLCLGEFRSSPVESLYVDAHELCKAISSVCFHDQVTKHPIHDSVFDNKYMKLFDARPNALCTFDLHIKHFFNFYQH